MLSTVRAARAKLTTQKCKADEDRPEQVFFSQQRWAAMSLAQGVPYPMLLSTTLSNATISTHAVLVYTILAALLPALAQQCYLVVN